MAGNKADALAVTHANNPATSNFGDSVPAAADDCTNDDSGGVVIVLLLRSLHLLKKAVG